jgi:hypothetical protein
VALPEIGHLCFIDRLLAGPDLGIGRSPEGAGSCRQRGAGRTIEAEVISGKVMLQVSVYHRLKVSWVALIIKCCLLDRYVLLLCLLWTQGLAVAGRKVTAFNRLDQSLVDGAWLWLLDWELFAILGLEQRLVVSKPD